MGRVAVSPDKVSLVTTDLASLQALSRKYITLSSLNLSEFRLRFVGELVDDIVDELHQFQSVSLTVGSIQGNSPTCADVDAVTAAFVREFED